MPKWLNVRQSGISKVKGIHLIHFILHLFGVWWHLLKISPAWLPCGVTGRLICCWTNFLLLWGKSFLLIDHGYLWHFWLSATLSTCDWGSWGDGGWPGGMCLDWLTWGPSPFTSPLSSYSSKHKPAQDWHGFRLNSLLQQHLMRPIKSRWLFLLRIKGKKNTKNYNRATGGRDSQRQPVSVL